MNASTPLLDLIDQEVTWYDSVITRSRKELAVLRMPQELKKLMNTTVLSVPAHPTEHAADSASTQKRARTRNLPALRIGKTRQYPQLYLITDPQHRSGIYLPKSKWHLARYIAQRDYLTRTLHTAMQNRQKLLQISKRLTVIPAGEDAFTRHLLQSQHPLLQQLITPVLQTDTEYAERWQSEPYDALVYREDEKIIQTERGEKVRSKSEKIIADKLFSLNIPYRYEAAVCLYAPKYIVYPDFTVLRLRDRQPVYIEHFGKMDDPDYAERTMEKIDEYAKNGIKSGKNAIFLFETRHHPLDTAFLAIQLKASGLWTIKEQAI